MQLLKDKLAIDFMGKRRIAVLFSATLLAIALFALITRGLNFGIDFTGGTLIEVGYPQAVELEPIRNALATTGFEGAQVQHFGSSRDVLVRIDDRDYQAALLRARPRDAPMGVMLHALPSMIEASAGGVAESAGAESADSSSSVADRPGLVGERMTTSV